MRTCETLPKFKKPATLAVLVAAIDFQGCDKTIHTVVEILENLIPQTNVLPFSGVNTKSNQINYDKVSA